MRIITFAALVVAAMLLVSCQQAEQPSIDIINALPNNDYQMVLWLSPPDYLASGFVRDFKANAGFIMPLITQYLGFDPEKVTERFGFPLTDCSYAAALVAESETAIIQSSLTAEEISANMSELLGYELRKLEYKGYSYYADPDVGRGFFSQTGTTAVTSETLIKQIIDNGLAEGYAYQHRAREWLANKVDSAGFISKPLADLDSANFARQLAKIEEDQEMVTKLTGAVAGIHEYHGHFNLNEKISGRLKMRCADASQAQLLGGYFQQRYPAIKEGFADRAVEQAERLAAFFKFERSDVINLLDTLAISSEDDFLIIEIDMDWAALAPFFSVTEAQ